MPKFSEELVQVFTQWKKMEDQATPIYLKMEKLIDQYLGSKKDDPIAHGRVIVELTSLTSPQSASTSTEESMTSPKNIQAGSKPSETEERKTQDSQSVSLPMPSPVREKNAKD